MSTAGLEEPIPEQDLGILISYSSSSTSHVSYTYGNDAWTLHSFRAAPKDLQDLGKDLEEFLRHLLVLCVVIVCHCKRG